MSIVRAIPDPPRSSDEGRELLAMASELRKGLGEYLAYAVSQLEQTPEQAIERIRSFNDPQDPESCEPDQVSWFKLGAQIEADPAAGAALWKRVRTAGREHVATGFWGSEALEGSLPQPYDRAIYLAIRDGLADGLAPRNGLDWLLIDQMAQALTMQHMWLRQHIDQQSLSVVSQERQVEQEGAAMPKRVAQAQEILTGAQMADRFQRSFLRVLKAYRDLRRLNGTVFVGDGGQVNLAEQQIVTTRRQDRPRQQPKVQRRRRKQGGATNE